MKKTVVAIVGCGAIAGAQHLPQISQNPKAEIKYAVDIVEERAKAAAEKYGIPHSAVSYREALSDPEVDCVFVLTPNAQHYSITMDALSCGKHVFCEKPAAVSEELARRMAEQAERNGLVLDVGVCNRRNRSVELIKQLIEAGELGEVYHAYASFRSYRSIPGLGGDFTTKAVAGGGVLIDWGVHFLDLVLYALGLPKVKTVSANAYGRLGKEISKYTYLNMWAGPPKPDGVYDVEEFVTGYIRTEKASISFNGAWAQNIDRDEMFVDFLGDKAGIRFDYFGGFTLFDEKNGVLREVRPKFALPNMYYAEEDAFFEAVRGNAGRTPNHIESVLETMRVLDAVYVSSRENREVVL